MLICVAAATATIHHLRWMSSDTQEHHGIREHEKHRQHSQREVHTSIAAKAKAPAHCLARSTGLAASPVRRAALAAINRLEDAVLGVAMPLGTEWTNVAIVVGGAALANQRSP